MNNIALGKTLKAMYKLSGKTLTRLSDETDLTVDTINNLFYARVQKPGLAGVNALVNAMGFTLQQLVSFLEQYPELPEDCDVTELFTNTVAAPEMKTTKEAARPVKAGQSAEVALLSEEHEKQMERYHAIHLQHVEQLKEQHREQIAQMQADQAQLEQHFYKSISALKETHERETERMDKEIAGQKKTIRLLTAAIIIETALALLVLAVDLINRGVGWLR